MEYYFEFDSSEDGQRMANKLREEGKPLPVKIMMPPSALIRRVGTKVETREIMGVHPETKQIGKMRIGEEKACLWAEVSPLSRLEERTFLLISSGLDVPKGDYIGTFVIGGGQFVFHVYTDGEMNSEG